MFSAKPCEPCFIHFVRYMLSSASVADPPIADILETTTLEPSTVDAADVQNRSVNASDVEVQRELRNSQYIIFPGKICHVCFPSNYIIIRLVISILAMCG